MLKCDLSWLAGWTVSVVFLDVLRTRFQKFGNGVVCRRAAALRLKPSPDTWSRSHAAGTNSGPSSDLLLFGTPPRMNWPHRLSLTSDDLNRLSIRIGETALLHMPLPSKLAQALHHREGLRGGRNTRNVVS